MLAVCRIGAMRMTGDAMEPLSAQTVPAPDRPNLAIHELDPTVCMMPADRVFL